MSQEFSGKGDPLKLMQLLWGKVQAPRRGPKPKVSLNELVTSAIAIADAEGIDAVSTRKVAEAVGISPMSFYTHVPSIAELRDLMLDQVLAECTEPPEGWENMNWHQRLTYIAENLWQHYMRHTWVVEMETHRPVMGPNTLASYELALSAVDGLGLDEIEMDLTVTSLHNYVLGAVRHAAREQAVWKDTGMSDTEWWYTIAPFMETLDFSPYPVSSRVGPIAGEAYGVGDPLRAFKFGLERFLDGMTLLIERKQGAPDQ
ncbi:TetR family transcriptional regulator [Alkalilimnicola ehrlichii]|uniref:TetR family transcriptional regulator n=1 Tax=Alkalilimnicola ehrlichii TaxID=351052 RepID=A0A3E0WMG9_9GAMM|nr:TetR/AcrR family transcriptional regulator [Alkalilimnicola ehrlichii]RFA27032.1 TetR family transcriptional regulator [Alkalilimnicola ehrlichii]RFA34154.1 TetR family transcriptional regulator [Alkalilimnicola ehrlichii]